MSSGGLTDRFDLAVKYLKDGGDLDETPSNADKLQFYALYKQSTTGDCNVSAPLRFKVADYAKWKAWKAMKGKEKEKAMQEYIGKAPALSHCGVGPISARSSSLEIVCMERQGECMRVSSLIH